MSPNLSTPMLKMSGLKSREAAVAVGRSILIDWSLIMVRLAIMNEASRKNMMSISGMISMRAFLCGKGEAILIRLARGVAAFRAEHGRFSSALPGGIDHHFNIGRGRLQFASEPRRFAGEKTEGDQRNDRDGQAAHGGDEGLADAAGDFLHG